MSTSTRDSSATTESLPVLSFDQLCLQAFPPEVDLDWLAVSTEGIQRVRQVDSGLTLLRLLLCYVVHDLSFRTLSGWASGALGLHLNDDSLRERFLRCEPFLRSVLQALLASHLGSRPGVAALRLVDATVLTLPGSQGTDWRVHATYDPSLAALVGVQVTDAHGAESMARLQAEPGDLAVGDRGYSTATQLHLLHEQGRHALVRLQLTNLRWLDEHGTVGNVLPWLQDAEQGQFEQRAWVPLAGKTPVKMRVVVVPLPKEKAARARQKLRANSRKKGHTPSALALRLAGFLALATTLSPDDLPAPEVLQTYRLRWQIELFFQALQKPHGARQAEEVQACDGTHLRADQAGLRGLGGVGASRGVLADDRVGGASAAKPVADHPPGRALRASHRHGTSLARVGPRVASVDRPFPTQARAAELAAA